MSWIENPGTEDFRGLNLTDLRIDEAYLNVTSILKQALRLYSLSDDCVRCPFTLMESIPGPGQHIFKINTARPSTWEIQDAQSSVLCRLNPHIGEFGVYDLLIGNDSNHCELVIAKDPVNIYLPLILLSIILLLVVPGIVGWGKFLWHRLHRSETEESEDIQRQQTRVKALDTFRGISIVVMIFVNDGAADYWWLEHATWNGLHVGDMVFPWFMWIMGVCIPISVRSQLARNTPRHKLLLNVLRRSCILFSLGLMLNTLGGKNELTTIRIFGVLQRFGVVYFIVASLVVLLMKGNYNMPTSRLKSIFQDVIVLIPQWCIIICILALHCFLTFHLRVPGCPTGYLGPGGIQDSSTNFQCIGGATGYIDSLILGVNHIYQHPTAKRVYQSGPFDPEGVLGCLMSVVQVFFGVQAGSIIIFHNAWKARVQRWLIWGLLTGLAAGIICGFSKEDGWIPVNKNMWSLSFALVTTSFAFILLTFCYVLIDVLRLWSGGPFLYPGMNATIMYVGHSIAYNIFPWHWKVGLMNTHFILLIEALWGTSLWVIIAYILYKKRIFLSV